jgi:hypothetical protein
MRTQLAARPLCLTADQPAAVPQRDRVPPAVARRLRPSQVPVHAGGFGTRTPQSAWGTRENPVGIGGGGQPLDSPIRTEMEARLDDDFSAVRVHTDGAAARSAADLQARAYTVGNAVVFGAAVYAPGTSDGRRVLAHELVHVQQQRQGSVDDTRTASGITVSDPGDRYEREAESVSDQAPRVPSGAAQPGASSATGMTSSFGPAQHGRQWLAGNAGVRTVVQRQPVSAAAAPTAETDYPHLGQPDPDAVPADPAATYKRLRAEVIAARDEQRRFADSLKGDMKYWFARVYSFVTQDIAEAADAGAFMYPIAVLQETLAFHATYKQNLTAWRSGNAAEVESNWKIAFQEAENVNDGSWYRFRSQEILSALLPSMQAHIRFDLPRAIASVYEANYAGKGVDLATFKGDFDRMGPIFALANAQIQPEIDRECWRVDPGDWHWLDTVGFPAIFEVAMERQHSFSKAGDIVSGHERGIHTQPGMETRLEAYSTGRHPLFGEDFSISTSWGSGEWAAKKVSDYDWNAQPQ